MMVNKENGVDKKRKNYVPGSTQSYNRYSYCVNNPLRYVDPNGYYRSGEPRHPDFTPIYYVHPKHKIGAESPGGSSGGNTMWNSYVTMLSAGCQISFNEFHAVWWNALLNSNFAGSYQGSYQQVTLIYEESKYKATIYITSGGP